MQPERGLGHDGNDGNAAFRHSKLGASCQWISASQGFSQGKEDVSLMSLFESPLSPSVRAVASTDHNGGKMTHVTAPGSRGLRRRPTYCQSLISDHTLFDQKDCQSPVVSYREAQLARLVGVQVDVFDAVHRLARQAGTVKVLDVVVVAV